MKTHLILDYGSRIVSALLVTPSGELVPCSQEIRHNAVRHVPAEILYEPRPDGDRELAWEEAADSLAGATARNVFQRGRRLGLRRLWEAQSSADAIHLRSPLSVLSSPAALADMAVAHAMRGAATTLIEATLDPLLTFAVERGLPAEAIHPIVILPAHAGQSARTALHSIFRRRGFARMTIVRREIAAAMALLGSDSRECQVWDVSDDDLRVHRVAIERHASELRLQTLSSETVRGLGRAYWVQQIAAAVAAPVAVLDRALTALTAGIADPASRVTHTTLSQILDGAWQRAKADDIASAMQKADAPVVLTGPLCALDPVRAVYASLGAAGGDGVPALDQLTRNVANVLLWLRADPARRLTIPPSGSLRINTFRGETIETISAAQLPEAGEHGHVTTTLRFAGQGGSDRSFLLHLMWGADRIADGNATLCALPLDLGAASATSLRLAIQLSRSRTGRRLSGRVEARVGGNSNAARVSFSQEFNQLTAEEMP